MPITYLTGDATTPCKDNGIRLIAHVNNDAGGWGRGFVVAISKRWKEPEKRYREWHKSCGAVKTSGKPVRVHRSAAPIHMPLGEIQVVPVKDEHGTLFVANMVAQHEYGDSENPVPLRYLALASCLKKLDEWIKSYKITKEIMVRPNLVGDVSIHMPRIGCGLAGGSWDKVELLIDTMLFEHEVFVYDFKKDAPFGRK